MYGTDPINIASVLLATQLRAKFPAEDLYQPVLPAAIFVIECIAWNSFQISIAERQFVCISIQPVLEINHQALKSAIPFGVRILEVQFSNLFRSELDGARHKGSPRVRRHLTEHELVVSTSAVVQHAGAANAVQH